MTQPCEKAKEIEKLGKCVAVLKSRWPIVWGIICVALILLGIWSKASLNSSARAQDAQASVITEIKVDAVKTKDAVHELEKVVIRIEERVNTALEESDRKQQETLEAIKALKE